MNKKEKAAMDEAIHRAELLAALRWTEPVEKDVPPPSSSWTPSDEKSFTEGWDFNTYSKTISKFWSESVSHGHGEYPLSARYRSASQGARALFSTEMLALKALRHAVEKKAAADLLNIDKAIKQAVKK